MAQVEKQILAAQKFLTGLHGLESIQGLRQKQADRIVNVIQGQKLSLEDAGKALDSVRSEIWGEELATVLKEAVAKQMDDSREPKSRIRLQDYKTLVHYLDRKHWEFLQQADFSRDTAVTNVCHLAVHLGLRHPNEGTFGAILAIVFCHDKAKSVSEQEKFYFLQQYKPQMRKIFQTAPVASEFVEVLPVDVANFPHALLNTAYPHGFEPFTPAHVDLIALKSLTDTYPLRKDNLKARSNEQSLQPSSSSSADTLLKGIMAIASAVGCGRAPAEQPRSVELPGFKLLQKPQADVSCRKPSEAPALLDVEAEVKESSKGTQAQEALETKRATAKPSSAEEMISVLQAGLEEEKLDQVPKEKGKQPPKQKVKPTPKKKAAAVKKRPAAASKASPKRPAVASGKAKPAKKHKAGSRLSPAEMAQARKKLFRKVPAELQDLWRNGCSGCRQRPNCTLSCWAKRGYYPD